MFLPSLLVITGTYCDASV